MPGTSGAKATYLEPDLHFGSAYLNATARAVPGMRRDTTIPKLLLVGHDAFPSGAQHLLLHIGKTLRSAFNVDVRFLLLSGGKLEAEYQAVAPVTRRPHAKESCSPSSCELREQGFTAAIVNTSASARVVPISRRAWESIRSALSTSYRAFSAKKASRSSARTSMVSSHKVVFASKFVREKLVEALKVEAGRAVP